MGVLMSFDDRNLCAGLCDLWPRLTVLFVERMSRGDDGTFLLSLSPFFS